MGELDAMTMCEYPFSFLKMKQTSLAIERFAAIVLNSETF